MVPTAGQKLPAAFPPQENISILMVSPHAEDEAVLRQLLHPHGSSVARVATVSGALSQIRSIGPAVVICERDLPDGNWRNILASCEVLPNPPLMLVISRHADENLWAEVLNLGGYDVLLKPFDRNEVIRILSMGCLQWSGRRTAKQGPSGQGLANLIAQPA